MAVSRTLIAVGAHPTMDTCPLAGLTILSATPHCHMVPLLKPAAATVTPTTATTMPRDSDKQIACMEQQSFVDGNIVDCAMSTKCRATGQQMTPATASMPSPSPATSRCCKLVGSSGVGSNTSDLISDMIAGDGSNSMAAPQHPATLSKRFLASSPFSFYPCDKFGRVHHNSNEILMTNSLSRRPTTINGHRHSGFGCAIGTGSGYFHHELMGIETLDILQGVNQGTITQQSTKCFLELDHFIDCLIFN